MTTGRIVGIAALAVAGALIIYVFPMIALIAVFSLPVLLKRLSRPAFSWILVIVVVLLVGARVIQSFV